MKNLITVLFLTLGFASTAQSDYIYEATYLDTFKMG